QPGATYRLRAQIRATQPGRASLGVQSFVAKAYFWSSLKTDIQASTEWTPYEWIVEVPAPGKPGWSEQMKHFSARIGWLCNNGTLQVRDLQLHQATPKKEWDAWLENGVDQHSLVADPLWDDPARFTLRNDSPAWALGFQRIPVEQIGPQPENR
ncbi:MAG: hypothetical protein WCL08_11420, partial [Verrucomicrobiota bacterium]